MLHDCIQLIVSVPVPHSILAIDARNAEILGYRGSELFGMSILLLCEPFSIPHLESVVSEAFLLNDSTRSIEFCDKWGSRHRYFASTSPHFEENETIASCLLTLKSNLGADDLAAISQSDFIWNVDGFEKGSSGISKIQQEIVNEKMIPTIWPRNMRKRLHSDDPSPITVTLDTIKAWQHLPQHQAAMCIGVSKTALKNACRKLGLERWPYKRLCGPESCHA